MRKRRGRCSRRAAQKYGRYYEPEELKKYPHTFVFHRGAVGLHIQSIIQDVRKMLEPFTASKLKPSRKNVIKDYVSIAGLFHVTHFWIFSKSSQSYNMRIVTLPRGPTLYFKIDGYTFSKEVVSSLRRPVVNQKLFLNPPLLIMSGMNSSKRELQLISTVFQRSLPPFNINTVKLSSVRRCILLEYDAEKDLFFMRHYAIKAIPYGVSKVVKKLISGRVPDLSNCKDISEAMYTNFLSESEGEGIEEKVILPQDIDHTINTKSSQTSIRLTEIGPRLTLKLFKIEDGVCEGNVLYPESQLSEEQVIAVKTKKTKSLHVKKKSKKKPRTQRNHLEQYKTPTEYGDLYTDKDQLEDDQKLYKEEVGVEPNEGALTIDKFAMKRRRKFNRPAKRVRFKL